MSRSSQDSDQTSNNGYFNSIFKNHLYYKRPTKELPGNENKKKNGEDSYNFLHYNRSPPKSAGFSLSENNQGEKTFRSESNSMTDSNSENNRHQMALTRANCKSLRKPSPKLYQNGESCLITRGKFKGRYDDRHVRCLYFEKKRDNDSSREYFGCESNVTKQCYCAHTSIVNTPLRNVINVSDVGDLRTDGHTHLNNSKKMSNIFEMFPSEGNDPKYSKDHRMIARVKQKFSADYEFKINTKNPQRTSKAHNLRRIGYHSKTQEELEPLTIAESMLKPTMTNIVLTS